MGLEGLCCALVEQVVRPSDSRVLLVFRRRIPLTTADNCLLWWEVGSSGLLAAWLHGRPLRIRWVQPSPVQTFPQIVSKPTEIGLGLSEERTVFALCKGPERDTQREAAREVQIPGPQVWMLASGREYSTLES